MKILVVDHEKLNRDDLADKTHCARTPPVTAADGQETLDRLLSEPFDVVFADAKVPKIDGVELLRRIKQGPRPETSVVMMSSSGSIPVAVQAVKLGAFDFLEKPIRPRRSCRCSRRSARSDRHRGTTQTLKGRNARRFDREIVGSSPAIERVKRMVRIASQTDANVLIHGETGVGKDLVASVIHRQSTAAELRM